MNYIKQQEFQISVSGNDYSVQCNLFEENFEDKLIYGLLLEKTDCLEMKPETETLSGITDDIDCAEYIFDTVVKNEVMPINLCEVIDDIISERELTL